MQEKHDALCNLKKKKKVLKKKLNPAVANYIVRNYLGRNENCKMYKIKL